MTYGLDSQHCNQTVKPLELNCTFGDMKKQVLEKHWRQRDKKALKVICWSIDVFKRYDLYVYLRNAVVSLNKKVDNKCKNVLVLILAVHVI